MLSCLTVPGDHQDFMYIDGRKVEAILTVPDDTKRLNTPLLAVLGHPHSLKGGTMHNKVVTTMMRVFRDLGIPSLRFNFRGVGLSEGKFDAGVGESDDMVNLIQQFQANYPALNILLAGFSFGSYVAYRAATQISHRLLLSIAPAVNHFDFDALSIDAPDNWVIIQGNQDEVVPPEMVFSFAAEHGVTCIKFEDSSHFFHGKLMMLRDTLTEIVKERVLRNVVHPHQT